MTGQPLFRPCTPHGVMKMLESEGVALRGAESRHRGRQQHRRQAHGHAAAAGGRHHHDLQLQDPRPGRADAPRRRAGRGDRQAGHDRRLDDRRAPSSSTGINRGADGKLCGDVDFASASQVAGAITPVPGGGPMTIAMLLVNTVEAAERAAGLTA